MRQALLIGHQDIRLFLSQKVAYVWLLLVPLLFSFFMGFANRAPGDPKNPRPRVLIDNRDEGFLGELLVQSLKAQALNVVDPERADEAERGVRSPRTSPPPCGKRIQSRSSSSPRPRRASNRRR